MVWLTVRRRRRDNLLPGHHFIIQGTKKVNYPTCTLGYFLENTKTRLCFCQLIIDAFNYLRFCNASNSPCFTITGFLITIEVSPLGPLTPENSCLEISEPFLRKPRHMKIYSFCNPLSLFCHWQHPQSTLHSEDSSQERVYFIHKFPKNIFSLFFSE